MRGGSCSQSAGSSIPRCSRPGQPLAPACPGHPQSRGCWQQTDRRQHSLSVECECVRGELIREADPGIHSTHLPNPRWKQIQRLFINKDSVLNREQTKEPV